jgi:hypothetical protein
MEIAITAQGFRDQDADDENEHAMRNPKVGMPDSWHSKTT